MNRVYVFYLGGFVREHYSENPMKIEFIPAIGDALATVCIHSDEELVFHEWDLIAKISSDGSVSLLEESFEGQSVQTQ